MPLLIERQVLTRARFWFIPNFWKKPLKELPTSFNARSETALSRRFFHGARRGLIPTSGFREFTGKAGNKTAVCFEKRSENGEQPEFFAFGGLYSTWHDPEVGDLVHTFAILTTEPSEQVRPVHHRMPLIVPQTSYQDWLDETVPYEKVLSDANRHSHEARLDSYECRAYGNSTLVEGPECIAPAMKQAQLFGEG